jgi:hypothetical protein
MYATELSASPMKPIPSSVPSSRSPTWAYNIPGLSHRVQDSQGAITLEKSVTSLYVPKVSGQPTCNTEQRVKNIRHVVRPVRYAPVVGILGRKNELGKLPRIDPTELVEDG